MRASYERPGHKIEERHLRLTDEELQPFALLIDG